MMIYQQTLAYILYDIPIEQEPLDLSTIQSLLTSPTTQSLFRALCTDRKATLIE